ncbi:hypothetical protein ACG02S_07915 [Roseateles sp. DC23W]|uniref:Superinfection immunity protein n=1 Tax=Pelomonas dachongensis TaxID=3299029 RepID=A0ABW7ENH3_9BURK
MTPARLALCGLVMALALAPFPLHLYVVAPELARHGHRGLAVLSLIGAVGWYTTWLHALPSFTPAQASQLVLKAEAATPDATDSGAPAYASPDGGPMGAWQPAAAGPSGGRA